MPPYSAPYVPVRRRRPLPAVSVGAPAASPPAPAAASAADPFGDILGGASQWNQENPGVLTALGAGLFSPAASNLANGFLNASKLQATAGNKQGVAKYLLDHGLADDPGEAQMLANNPTLMASLFKDNTYADMVAQRAKIAPLLGIKDQSDPRWAQFIGAGSFDTSQSGSNVANMTPTERAALADQYELQGDDRKHFILTGSMPSNKARGITSTMQRQLFKDQDALPGLENTLSTLDQAEKLLDSGKVQTGLGSGTLARTSMGVGGWGSLGSEIGGLIMDPEVARTTKQFNDIMSEKAIQSMSETLKGASTNYEMQQFLSIAADPANDIQTRKKALGRLKRLIQAERDMRASRIDSISSQDDMSGGGVDTGGDYTGGGGGAAGGWSIQEETP